jgi:peptide/nickel transport system permease protein
MTPWRRLRHDRRAQLSLAWLALLILVALFAGHLAPYPPEAQDANALLLSPQLSHPLGTDDLGQDTLSRLIAGAPNSLYATVLAVCVALLVGVPLGLLAGYLGGWIDTVISRVIDTLLSFPAIVLAIAATGALGINLTNAMLSVGIVFSPGLARLVRAQVLLIRSALYVDAAAAFGAGPIQILRRHILPNVMGPIVVQATLLLGIGLLAEATLSFLSLGVQPPAVSWGGMLARAYTYMEVAPDQMYPPGLAILLTALSFNALGESLRAALEPGGVRQR